ncbi:MAG: thioredoxin, partial [Candidatus Tectomicrobia bacterium]|nr:thioredoxin [Candidatus Tectomicrobia bacterium]
MEFRDVRHAVWADALEAIETCYELGWTDGLPVVPPTVQRVSAFLEYVQREPDEVLGTLPERRREVTVGKVAANAVMAGCKP